MPSPRLGDVELHLVETLEDAMDFMRWLVKANNESEYVAVDTETTGLQPYHGDRLRLIQFGDRQSGWSLPWPAWSGLAIETLEMWQKDFVFHNAKFDVSFIEHECDYHFPRERVQDTYLMRRLTSPNGPAGLKEVAAMVVDPAAAKLDHQLAVAFKEQSWTWETVPTSFHMYWSYAALDPILTARVYDWMRGRRMPSQASYDLERSMTWAALEMERRGIKVDMERVAELRSEMTLELQDLEAEVVREYGVRPGSGDKVAQVLLMAGVELTAQTPTKKWAMTAEVLETIDHPLAELVVHHRKQQKILTTYLDNFHKLVDVNDFVHPHINVTVAKTGRMSITAPALQTLPRTSTVRACFIPDNEDHDLWAIDYDQIEMRLAAHFSRDKNLIAAILDESVDVHTATARLVFNDEGIDKRDPRRQTAKTANFAKLYGAGVDTFAHTAGIPLHEARAFNDRYDVAFPGVQRLYSEVERIATQRRHIDGVGWVQSPLGRRYECDPGREYALVNYLIQGTAAEVLKHAVARIDQAGLLEHVRLPVHDELILSLPKVGGDVVAKEIARLMHDDSYVVPLTVDVSGPLRSWGEKYLSG